MGTREELKNLADGIYIGLAVIVVMGMLWYPAYKTGYSDARADCRTEKRQ